MPLLMALRPSYGLVDADSEWAGFASDLAFELWVDPAAPGEGYCRVLFCGRVLSLPPGGGRADGVCSLAALRGWLGGRGLLMASVSTWNALCKHAWPGL